MGPLVYELLQWDQKSASAIGAIFERHGADPQFVDQLLDCLGEQPLQSGATWLLKRYLEGGGALSDGQVATLYGAAGGLRHWSARLHLLQMMPMIGPARLPMADTLALVNSAVDDGKTLVRAWGIGGLMLMCERDAQLMADSRGRIGKAMAEGPASVRARIRQVASRDDAWRFIV